jgi:hypothetical protein
MSQDITEPLRLAVGSHEAGKGYGCAMNIISWENGDTEITDLPSCSDKALARMVQEVNDEICSHTKRIVHKKHEEESYPDYTDVLCPDCSLKALTLAHRTVGTGGLPEQLSDEIWFQICILNLQKVIAAHEALPKLGRTRARRVKVAKDLIEILRASLDEMREDHGRFWTVSSSHGFVRRRMDATELFRKYNINEDRPDDGIFRMLVWDIKQLLDADRDWQFNFVQFDELGRQRRGPAIGFLEGTHRVIDLWDEVTGFKAPEMEQEKIQEAWVKLLASAHEDKEKVA